MLRAVLELVLTVLNLQFSPYEEDILIVNLCSLLSICQQQFLTQYFFIKIFLEK